MADEALETPAPEEGSITDEQLAAVFGEDFEAEEKKTEDVPEPEEEKAEEEAEPEGLDTAELDAWEKPEEEAPKPETPEYLNELAKVLPIREAASFAIEAFQKQHQFDQAVNAGNIEQAMTVLPTLRPMLERATQEYVAANEEKIVQAWIERNDPENQNPEVLRIREELKELKEAYESRNTKEREAEERARQVEQQKALKSRQEAIDVEIPKLLDGIRFTAEETNRGVVADLIRVELSRDREAFQRALRGDMKAIKPAVARAVKRLQAYDATMKPPPKAPDAEIVEKGGIGTDTEPDVFERATNWLSSHLSQ